jgi:hypothetical protein
MGVTVDSYIDVEPGSTIGYDIRALDREAEIVIGPRHSLSDCSDSTVRLLLSDEDTFTELAEAVIRARDELAAALRERDHTTR